MMGHSSMKGLALASLIIAVVFAISVPAGWASDEPVANYTESSCWNIINPTGTNLTDYSFEVNVNMSLYTTQNGCNDVIFGNATSSFGYWNFTTCDMTGASNTTWIVKVPEARNDNVSQICIHHNNSADNTFDANITQAGILGDDFEDDNISEYEDVDFLAHCTNGSVPLAANGYIHQTNDNDASCIGMTVDTFTTTGFKYYAREYTGGYRGTSWGYFTSDGNATGYGGTLYRVDQTDIEISRFEDADGSPAARIAADEDISRSANTWYDAEIGRKMDGTWAGIHGGEIVDFEDKNDSDTNNTQFSFLYIDIRDTAGLNSGRVDHYLYTKWCDVCSLSEVAAEPATINITGCINITSSGTYQVQNDIVQNQTNCFDIQADDVVIDGNGYSTSRTSGNYMFYVNGSNIEIYGFNEVNTNYYAMYITGETDGFELHDITTFMSNRHTMTIQAGANDIHIHDIGAFRNNQAGYKRLSMGANVTNFVMEDIASHYGSLGSTGMTINGVNVTIRNVTFGNANIQIGGGTVYNLLMTDVYIPNPGYVSNQRNAINNWILYDSNISYSEIHGGGTYTNCNARTKQFTMYNSYWHDITSRSSYCNQNPLTDFIVISGNNNSIYNYVMEDGRRGLKGGSTNSTYHNITFDNFFDSAQTLFVVGQGSTATDITVTSSSGIVEVYGGMYNSTLGTTGTVYGNAADDELVNVTHSGGIHASATLRWGDYYSAHVTNKTQDDVENANVTITNTTGDIVYTGLTDASGKIPVQTIYHSLYVSGTGTLADDHRITATEGGLVAVKDRDFAEEGSVLNHPLTFGLDACQDINQSGVYYLSADIATNEEVCFNITASDVIFDGNEQVPRLTMNSNTTSPSTAIKLSGNINNVTIQNMQLYNNLTDFSNAVRLIWGVAGYTQGDITLDTLHLHGNSNAVIETSSGAHIGFSLSATTTDLLITRINQSYVGGSGLDSCTNCVINRSIFEWGREYWNNGALYIGGGTDEIYVYDNKFVNIFRAPGGSYFTANAFRLASSIGNVYLNVTKDCSRQNIMNNGCVGGNWWGQRKHGGSYAVPDDVGSWRSSTDVDGDGIGETSISKGSFGIGSTNRVDYLPLSNASLNITFAQAAELDGYTYEVMNDFACDGSCIWSVGDGTTVNGNGYTVTYASNHKSHLYWGGGNGLSGLSGKDNLVVRDLNIQINDSAYATTYPRYPYAINFDNSDNMTLDNVRVLKSGASTGSSDRHKYGGRIVNCDDCTFKNGYFWHRSPANHFTLQMSGTNLLFTNNTVYSQISSNTAGLDIFGSGHNISYNTIQGVTNSRTVAFSSVTNSYLHDNEITSQERVLYFTGTLSGNQIYNNNLTNANDRALHLQGETGDIYTNNYIMSPVYTAYIVNSDSNIFTNNRFNSTASSLSAGSPVLYFDGTSTNNTITGGEIRSDASYAVTCAGSGSNLIQDVEFITSAANETISYSSCELNLTNVTWDETSDFDSAATGRVYNQYHIDIKVNDTIGNDIQADITATDALSTLRTNETTDASGELRVDLPEYYFNINGTTSLNDYTMVATYNPTQPQTVTVDNNKQVTFTFYPINFQDPTPDNVSSNDGNHIFVNASFSSNATQCLLQTIDYGGANTNNTMTVVNADANSYAYYNKTGLTSIHVQYKMWCNLTVANTTWSESETRTYHPMFCGANTAPNVVINLTRDYDCVGGVFEGNCYLNFNITGNNHILNGTDGLLGAGWRGQEGGHWYFWDVTIANGCTDGTGCGSCMRRGNWNFYNVTYYTRGYGQGGRMYIYPGLGNYFWYMYNSTFYGGLHSNGNKVNTYWENNDLYSLNHNPFWQGIGHAVNSNPQFYHNRFEGTAFGECDDYCTFINNTVVGTSAGSCVTVNAGFRGISFNNNTISGCYQAASFGSVSGSPGGYNVWNTSIGWSGLSIGKTTDTLTTNNLVASKSDGGDGLTHAEGAVVGSCSDISTGTYGQILRQNCDDKYADQVDTYSASIDANSDRNNFTSSTIDYLFDWGGDDNLIKDSQVLEYANLTSTVNMTFLNASNGTYGYDPAINTLTGSPTYFFKHYLTINMSDSVSGEPIDNVTYNITDNTGSLVTQGVFNNDSITIPFTEYYYNGTDRIYYSNYLLSGTLEGQTNTTSFNFTTSQTVHLEVPTDTAGPVCTLISPFDTERTGDNTTTFTWSCTDQTAVDQMHYQISNDSAFTDILYEANQSTSTYTIPAPGLPDNPEGEMYYWRVAANDTIGYMGNWTDNQTFTIDTVNPDIIWYNWSLLNNTVSGIATHTLNVTCANTWLGGTNLTVWNDSGIIIYENLTENISNPIGYIHDTFTLDELDNTIEIGCYDSLAASPSIRDRIGMIVKGGGVTEFNASNGDKFNRTFMVYTGGGTPLPLLSYLFESINEWIDNDEHIKTTWKILPLIGNMYIEINLTSADRQMYLLQDRGRTRIVDSRYEFYWSFEDMTQQGFDLEYQQYDANTVRIIVNKGTYTIQGIKWELDPIVGGLHQTLEHMNLEVDLTDPVVTIYEPENVTYNQTYSIPITFNASDKNLEQMWYVVYNMTGDTIVSKTYVTGNDTISMPQAGQFYVTLTANDSGSNEGSDTEYFSIFDYTTALAVTDGTVNVDAYEELNASIEVTSSGTVSYTALDSVSGSYYLYNSTGDELQTGTNLTTLEFFGYQAQSPYNIVYNGIIVEEISTSGQTCPPGYSTYADYCARFVSTTEWWQYYWRMFLESHHDAADNYDVVYNLSRTRLIDWEYRTTTGYDLDDVIGSISFVDGDPIITFTIGSARSMTAAVRTFDVNYGYAASAVSGGGGGGGGRDGVREEPTPTFITDIPITGITLTMQPGTDIIDQFTVTNIVNYDLENFTMWVESHETNQWFTFVQGNNRFSSVVTTLPEKSPLDPGYAFVTYEVLVPEGFQLGTFDFTLYLADQDGYQQAIPIAVTVVPREVLTITGFFLSPDWPRFPKPFGGIEGVPLAVWAMLGGCVTGVTIARIRRR